MLRVGLTGGMAGGKSAASAIFRELGAVVSQSDQMAREMMEPGEAVHKAIVDHFGPLVLREDGCLDRGMLARLAFQEGRVEELNALVHPPVIAAQQQWLKEMATEHPEAVAIVESALLLETRYAPAEQPGQRFAAAEEPVTSLSWRDRFNHIVLVTARESLRMERYIARALASDPSVDRALLRQDAQSRFAAQMPEERKAAFADVIIHNDGSRGELRARVEAVYRDLQAEAREGMASGNGG